VPFGFSPTEFMMETVQNVPDDSKRTILYSTFDCDNIPEDMKLKKELKLDENIVTPGFFLQYKMLC